MLHGWCCVFLRILYLQARSIPCADMDFLLSIAVQILQHRVTIFPLTTNSLSTGRDMKISSSSSNIPSRFSIHWWFLPEDEEWFLSLLGWLQTLYRFFNSTISFTFRWWHPIHLTPHLSIYLANHHKGQRLHSYFTQWIIIRYCIYFFWCSDRGPWQPL